MINLLILTSSIFNSWSIQPTISDNEGLYLPLGEKTCYYQELKYKDEVYCIPEVPLIPVKHFKKIGALRSAGPMDFFDVDIDKQGTKKLYLLQENLKGLSLAFVMNEEIIGMIELDDKNSSHQIRFYSVGFEAPLKEIHDHLETILKSKKD
ncbi:hypothetical protein [Fulvivirga sp.]|uniref:hypothetical protein n=1 Tax=Fulvivirga sp. TaxID=1931237 RepID=UPI0032EF922D